ncbi:hypothetical protein PLESTB_001011600 [Pleodorina starrii]|uniref:Uncharacterized protein n=1 Tax=Pleodorina starrii TaxID=330485 RepID=A0A9W6BPZ7_9CHLO|nr:hypothetical protein PLESTM_001195800 [Pleodorina starrii]GLC55657.1 hypothetical protein PLESTB_001011600 [Pleodorina starrii]GLC65407.1 hypothetical protein PLESTF_000290100 [Pleodorina starrii]
MPYYVVGRDWPDNFYATNAKWPEPNQWTSLPEGRRKPFHASTEEVKRAVELEKQEAARRESQKLKKQLFAAIVQRDAEAVRRLVRRTPLLLQRHTNFGATPLGLAAAVGDPAIVAFLLDEGCDVAEGDRVGATPLMMAASRGHTQICQQLLGSKQGGNHGRAYLLHQATRRAGEVAAHAAAKGGHLDTLAALLAAAAAAAGAAGAAAEAAGAAAEAAGAGAGPAGSVGPRGADVMDREGRDCFQMAAANDHPNVMSYLLQNHGASAARADSLGRTALMHAAAAGAVQAVQLLLSLDPPLELTQTDHQGYGPLHHACLGGSVEVVEALSQRGLALSPTDPGSLALLRLACKCGHEAVVDWMLRAGVGLRELVADGGGNPVFAAVRGGSSAVVDVLLAHGARIDPRDTKGRTPLGVAAEAGDTAMCQHLVAAGADLLAADNHGRVPRRLAYQANQRDTAEALSGMARLRLLVGDDAVDEQMYRELDEEAARREAAAA